MLEARLQYAARKQRAVSQAAMASAVASHMARSLTQSAWSDYESGETEPSLEILTAVAELSGLRREYLAWGTLPRESGSPVGDSSPIAQLPQMRVVREQGPNNLPQVRRRKKSR